MIWVYVLIAIVLLIVIIIYNGLVRLKNQVENSWAQIDVQLKRRTDLIPNLIESVKGYMKHERETLNELTKARTAFMKAGTVKEKADASNMLTNTLKSLFAVAENYPNLKANENFLQLQEELSGTENKISYARQNYNDMVMLFNTRIAQIPFNIFAGMMSYKRKDLFQIEESEKKNVKVSF
jgi:LemA protein